MGKLVVTEFVSLDGVFEGPGGGDFEHAGWTFRFDRGDEGNTFKLEELRAADAQLLGRVTYERFAQAWPTMTDNVGFAERMNGMPKFVVSAHLASADWNNSTVIRDDVAGEVAALKQRFAGDILVAGSGQLVRALLRDALVDELRLMIFPIVLGTGQRLFSDGTPTMTLKLVDKTPLGPDGIVVLSYAPA